MKFLKINWTYTKLKLNIGSKGEGFFTLQKPWEAAWWT